jgi:hypothetical protein
MPKTRLDTLPDELLRHVYSYLMPAREAAAVAYEPQSYDDWVTYNHKKSNRSKWFNEKSYKFYIIGMWRPRIDNWVMRQETEKLALQNSNISPAESKRRQTRGREPQSWEPNHRHFPPMCLRRESQHMEYNSTGVVVYRRYSRTADLLI